jgi:Ran GTPase-activating protein (RanGAP) involved in mRNA processing and transport
MERFLLDSFRRDIDSRIDRLIVNHNVNSGQRATDFITESANDDSAVFDVTGHGTQINALHAAAIYQEKCADLDLRPNPLAEKRFVEQFMNSICRSSLRFSGLGLGARCMQCVVGLLHENLGLVFVVLSLNRLGDGGGRILGEYFGTDSNMIYVDLRSNGIGIPGCVAMFEGLKTNSHITNVDISAVNGIERNRIGAQGCQMLSEVLRANQVLSCLNVGMCSITAHSCQCLSRSLLSNNSLSVLDLTANRFGSQGAMNLFQFDGSFGELTTLILARNGIGDEASGCICRQLQVNKTLRTLNLSGNHLSTTFLRKLYSVLHNSCRLRTLNLSKNRLGPECEDTLSLLLQEFSGLHHLNLSGNPLKDAAFVPIANGLTHNTTLLTLDLSEVGMMDEGACAIAAAIREHLSLQRLYLAANKITDAGGVILGKALCENKNIVIFSLRNNELKDDTADALLEALAVNTTIYGLEFSYNDFSYRSYVKLTQTIEEHKRTLSSNVAEIAARHIEWLRDEERRLFDYRREIKAEEVAVENITQQRDLKREELANLTKRKQAETDAVQAELNEVRGSYEEISEQRRARQQEMSDAKVQMELRQAAAAEHIPDVGGEKAERAVEGDVDRKQAQGDS